MELIKEITKLKQIYKKAYQSTASRYCHGINLNHSSKKIVSKLQKQYFYKIKSAIPKKKIKELKMKIIKKMKYKNIYRPKDLSNIVN